MADLVVDVDGLDVLVGTIKRIQQGLDDTPSVVDDSSGVMGSSDVSGAMDHFQDHWHDGRKHINDNADTMTSMLGDSVQAYRKTDNDLSSSLTQNESTTHIGSGGGGGVRAE